MTNKVISLFPIALHYSKFYRDFNKKELLLIDKYENETDHNTGNKITINHNVLEDDTFIELKNFFKNSLNDYVNNVISPSNNVEIYITESWINYTTNNQYHHQHNHPNSFLSGVFYFNCLEKDSITFFKKDKGFFDIETNKYNLYNSNSWIIPVNKGELLLFPSSLEHLVEKNNTNDKRISLSFNTFIKGNINNNKSTKLCL
jgi:uncharacterized protein (TIGR02466 family)